MDFLDLEMESFKGKHADITNRVLFVFYRVYNELGHGFLESVYEEAMVISLAESGLKVQRQVPIPVWYHGKKIGDFKADLLVEEKVFLELKAVNSINPAHAQQTLNYLRATDIEVGLLLNFGLEPQIKRLMFDNENKSNRVDLMDWIKADTAKNN